MCRRGSAESPSIPRTLVALGARPWATHGGAPRDLPVSKARLNAFMVKVAADPSLKARVQAAADASAEVAIAHEEGHSFSPASWTRHLRG